MAHRLAFKPTGNILTCNLLDEWSIYVDGTFVDVKLTAPGGIVVLNERYYAYGGGVKLYDIGSLVESNMRSSGYQYAAYTLALLNVDGTVADSCTFHAIYCDRFSVCTDTDVFLAENFLTTLSMRRVPADTVVSLFYFANSGESSAAKISYRWRSSAVTAGVHAESYAVTGATLNSAGVQQINVGQSSMIDDAHRKYGIPSESIEIVEFTVSIGQRSLTFFVDRSLRYEDAFVFRNCFNVWDIAYFPLSTTAKTEVERSTAIVNQTSQFYNQRVTKGYEVQSGTLTSDEAEWIDQLFTSYEVIRFVPNDCDDTEPYLMQQVLITESHCEISDGDEKPNTVKFTWRYADNRAIVRLTASPGIFTSPYNIVFS